MVQIRDLKTHRPLKGVEIGDVGAKYGFNAKDNGYLKLRNVRIPRVNMLMKYIVLNKFGELKIVGNPKMIYANMVKTRMGIYFFN